MMFMCRATRLARSTIHYTLPVRAVLCAMRLARSALNERVCGMTLGKGESGPAWDAARPLPPMIFLGRATRLARSTI